MDIPVLEPAVLPRENRLRVRRDFDSIYSRGCQLRSPFLGLYAAPADGPAPRIGISVSKRVGGAVQRNLVKRRLREVCRQLVSENLIHLDLVIVARPSALDASYQELARTTRELLVKAEQQDLRWNRPSNRK